MFKQIHIKGYRSCRDVTLADLGFMTALVGQNGSGKTNLLRAIRHFADLATTPDILPALHSLDPLTFQAEIECDGQTFRFVLGLKATTGRGATSSRRGSLTVHEKLSLLGPNKEVQTVYHRDGLALTFGEGFVTTQPGSLQVGPRTPGLSAIFSLLPGNLDLVRRLTPLRAFLQRVGYYPLDEANTVQGEDTHPIISNQEYELWKDRFHRDPRSLDSVLFRLLHLTLENENLFKQFLGLMDERGLNLFANIKREIIQPVTNTNGSVDRHEPDRYYQFHFYPGRYLGGGNQPRAFGDLSLGTRRILRILTSLFVDDRSVMLIEHPEEGLHPGLVRRLLGLLEAHTDPTQMVLSSHSPTALNQLKPEMLRLVSIHEGATAVRSLTARELKRASDYINEEGTLSEFVEALGE